LAEVPAAKNHLCVMRERKVAMEEVRDDLLRLQQ
jgi:hypothetical protein